MKFGTYFAYWEQEWEADYSSYCKKVKDLGFDILEVAAGGLMKMSEQQLIDLKNAAKEQDIILSTCIGLPPEYNVASLNEQTRRNGIEFMKQIFKVMNTIGSKMIGGIIYAYWPVDYSKPIQKEKEKAASILSIKELADDAAQYGITMMLEVVNRFEQYIINDAKEAVQFVKEIDKPNVKVMLDCFHMNIEEDFLGDAIRYTGDYLGHFHIGEANRKVPGKGHMAWDELGQALRDIGYTGGVVMEPFVKMGGTVGSDIKVFRDLSDNADDEKMDDDIRQSLVFVKEKFLKG